MGRAKASKTNQISLQFVSFNSNVSNRWCDAYGLVSHLSRTDASVYSALAVFDESVEGFAHDVEDVEFGFGEFLQEVAGHGVAHET